MANDDLKKVREAEKSSGVTRREFIKYSAGTAAILSLGLYGCGNSSTSENSPVGTTSSEPVFFVHISDSHFGGDTLNGESLDPTWLQVIPRELMSALINGIVPVVQPLATIHTGDIVNAGYQLKPWQSYAEVFANTTMTYPKNYIEIPGNHDVKVSNTTASGRDIGDGRQLFTRYSVIGQTLGNDGDKFGLTEISSPVGTVRLVRTNTAASENQSLTVRNNENIAGYFSSAQQQSLLNDLSLSQPAALSVVLGHHPIVGSTPIATGNDLMKEVIAKAGAPIYLCGHVHVPDTMWSGNTLVVQADTFGRRGEPSSFYMVAYDEGVASAKLVTFNATDPFEFGWPLVFITSPANGTLGGSNPNAAPFTPDQKPKLRTMVFTPDATAVKTVQYSVDGGAFNHELINTAGRLWEAPLDLQGLSRGPHAVTVRATLSHGQIGIDTISITVS